MISDSEIMDGNRAEILERVRIEPAASTPPERREAIVHVRSGRR